MSTADPAPLLPYPAPSLGSFCARYKKRPVGEPTACYLLRHHNVTTAPVSVAMLRQQVLHGDSAAQAAISARRIGTSSHGLFMIVSHRHTVEYALSAAFFQLSRGVAIVGNSSLLMFLHA